MTFRTLGLMEELVRAVEARGYTQPTPIQIRAVPEVLAERDILAGAQTGTGKTAAFTLPMLQLLQSRTERRPTAARPDPHADPGARRPGRGELPHLRPAPASALGRHLRRRRHAASGRPAAPRRRHRGRHPGTAARSCRPAAPSTSPGSRSWCWTRPTACSTWASSTTSAGCSRCCRKRRQNLLFSATYSKEIEQLADGLLHDPVMIEVARRNTAAETVPTGCASGGEDPQARAALPPDSQRGLGAGAGLHPHQARRQPALRPARPGRHQRRRHSRQQEPERPHPRASGLQAWRGARAGRDRYRRPRAWTSTVCPTW